MAIFQHPLWGYEVTYPKGWVQRSIGDVEGFAAVSAALQPGYEGPQSGHLLVRGEWNSGQRPLEPLWKRHIGKTAGFLGAKKVGAAPWRIGDATGFEAEIVLPKREKMRLWTGILARGFTVLHFMVSHLKEERAWFEPLVTGVIASLHFPTGVDGVVLNEEGLPLPPDYVPADASAIVEDIAGPAGWQAYEGPGSVGALQAFYWRETAVYGWRAVEYIPFPNTAGLGFARLRLHKGEQAVMLGIMPAGEGEETAAHQAHVVIKYE